MSQFHPTSPASSSRRAPTPRGIRQALHGPSRSNVRTAPAATAARVLLVVIAMLSVSNFNPALMPSGIANLQQVIVLLLWTALALATAFVRPVLRVGTGLEIVAVVAFYGFAVVSVVWSDMSPATLLKGAALAATTFCAYRVATRMRIDDVVDCCIVAFAGVAGVSVVLVVFVPTIGIDATWMHAGEWQGVFESKQSLGTVGAFLMFFAFHRVLTRGGRWSFGVTFILALGCVIGSGSRGGGALALAACASLYFGIRSATLAKWLAFGPLFMSFVAIALISYLTATGYEYIPIFGIKVDFTERAIIWQYALGHFVEHPVLGYGLNGFWSIEQVYHNFDREHGWVLDNYHDGYIAILTETGIVGMTLFIVSNLLFGIKMWWTTQQGVLHRAHTILVVGLVNLIFFIDFTETFFLRSTNIASVLLVITFYLAGAVPKVGARPARVLGSVPKPPTGSEME